MTFTSRLDSSSLAAHPQKERIRKILSAALEAADPAQAVERTLSLKNGLLQIGKISYLLGEIAHLYIVAFGKAAPAMASTASTIIGDALDGGIVVSKYATADDLSKLEMLLAGHPVPDERSLTSGKAILKLLRKCGKDDLVIFLISGGGSALVTAPFEGIPLSTMQDLTSLLLASGARIDEINTLRRALDRVKGGGLAEAAYPARIVSLILSDVVDSPLEAIASGPTVPNPTTASDALAVLKKYNLLAKTPAIIREKLQENQRGNLPLAAHNATIIGSNRISAEAALKKATQEGFQASILTTSLQGEAAEKGRELAAYLRGLDKRPQCVIVGGETTVSLGHATGLGGRNQELALAAVAALDGARDVMLITLATDGDDGPTDAAGAVVTGDTFQRAQTLGLQLDAHLNEHNAYPFFSALDDLLIPGPTGTNVNDLTFLFAF